MLDVFIAVFTVLMVCSSVFAIMFTDYIKAVISLAATSVFLTVILFILGMPWAAVIQLSVSGGLISLVVLKIMSLKNNGDKKADQNKNKWQLKLLALPVSLVLFGIIVVIVLLTGDFSITFGPTIASTFESFGNLLFQSRQVDIFALIILLLAGGLAGIFLFKECEEL